MTAEYFKCTVKYQTDEAERSKMSFIVKCNEKLTAETIQCEFAEYVTRYADAILAYENTVRSINVPVKNKCTILHKDTVHSSMHSTILLSSIRNRIKIKILHLERSTIDH